MRDGRTSLLQMLVLALLAACAMRFLTPVGWMPSASANSGPTLVICTGHGAQPAPSPGHPGQGPTPSAHEACPFAGFVALDPPAPPALRLPGLAWTAGPEDDAITDLWRSPAPDYRRQAPRGPPILT
jgi:hypothetical protein